MKNNILIGLLYAARNLRSRKLFAALLKYCHGSVLDVGGRDFYRTARQKRIAFDRWTILEPEPQAMPADPDDRVHLEIGDGCRMTFQDDAFDTVLNIQVLEHVFEPQLMMNEMCRVLKPGGCLIMLIPQTATLHMIPRHYYNFTRYWIREALRRNGMQEVELHPMGGVWSTMASHLVYFVFQSIRYKYMSAKEFRRPWLFYPLYPLMLLFAAVAFPVCMLLSMGDLTEEPNNHLVVARKADAQKVASRGGGLA